MVQAGPRLPPRMAVGMQGSEEDEGAEEQLALLPGINPDRRSLLSGVQPLPVT